MKKKNTFITICLGIIIIVGGWMVFSEKIKQPLSREESRIPQEDIEKGIILVIDDGKGSPKVFETEFSKGVNVFDLLKKKAEELGMSLKTKNYDIGIMIEKIGDTENGEDGKYWFYYVNENMPMVSADKKEINPGDKVEFKFERSPF